MGSIKDSVFKVLRKPLITEKTASVGTVGNKVVFEVHPDANKREIKESIEKIFSVKVVSVRTVNSLGKMRRVKNKGGQQRDWKKAYVTLKEGNSIDVVQGI